MGLFACYSSRISYFANETRSLVDNPYFHLSPFVCEYVEEEIKKSKDWLSRYHSKVKKRAQITTKSARKRVIITLSLDVPLSHFTGQFPWCSATTKPVK